MQGGFVALSKDKIPPIPLHKTWPGVPAPSRLGPWTWSQEPRSTDSKAPIHVSAFSVTCAQVALDSFARAAVRGPSHACLAKPSKWGIIKPHKPMIVEHNESQPQTMALRPKLAGYSVRGPDPSRDALCQRPARLPVGRCKLHGGASTGPRTKDGLARLTEARTKHGQVHQREAGRSEALCRGGAADARRTEGAGGLVRGPRSFGQELAGPIQISPE